MKRRYYVILIISALMICFCMGIIFYFSSQDCGQTNMLSHKFTEKIAATVFSGFSAMDENMKTAVTAELNLFIRKLAHFSLYFLMSMVIYVFFSFWKRKYLMSGFFSVLICFIYASLDEYHQSFVPGRTPLVKDVVIDTSGALLGSIFCFMIIASCTFIYNKCRRN
ncbi:VanZ family protein [Porcipelethomonas sp.]|uniref:VanZ family protein n=1 Tax=Porcipelethomonas sp. TaxID=2981675 RepID=UPI003EF225A0